MAFNYSSGNELLQIVGSFGNIAVGFVTMASGAATVTVPQFTVLKGIVGCVQGATGVGETVICTATSTNTASLETVSEGGSTTGTSVVMWIAWGIAKR